MNQWYGQQCALAIKIFYKNGNSLTVAQREFLQNINDFIANVFSNYRRFYKLGHNGAISSKHTIKCCFNNFEEIGSGQDNQEVLVLHRTLILYANLSCGAHSIQFLSN